MSARLYVAVAILAIVPIWSVRYLPTVDGPSHVYNSWILHELLRGHDGPVAQWFEIDKRPHPNWIGHAIMAVLMFAVSPIIAEKLFMTGLIALFLYAMWRYARTPFAAFIGVPFAYNRLLHFGFYNFCFGSALYFLTVAIWWRRRDRPNGSTISLVAAMLIVCYFSHAMTVLLGMGSIGLLWLLTIRGRRIGSHALHLLSFIPVLPLLWWFRSTGATYLDAEVKGSNLIGFLARGDVLYSLGRAQKGLAIAVMIALLFAIIVTLVRREWTWREDDAWMVLSVVICGLYLLSVFVAADMRDRMALFVSLSFLSWLDLRLTSRAQSVATIAAAIVCVAWLGYVVSRYRVVGSYIQRYVQSAEPMGERSTFMPVLYEIGPPDNLAPVYYHAVDYAALRKESVDISNYEPVLAYFPIAMRPGVEPGNIFVAKPENLNPANLAARAQYIFAWKMPVDVRERLATWYTFISESDGGSVFRNRALSARSSAPARATDRVSPAASR